MVGNGLFKPNISTMVGRLYAPDDVRRDSGFTIFYMGINAGGALAPLICGTADRRALRLRMGLLHRRHRHVDRPWRCSSGGITRLGDIGKAPAGGEGIGPHAGGGARARLVAVPLVYLLLSQKTLVGWLLIGLFLALTVYLHRLRHPQPR